MYSERVSPSARPGHRAISPRILLVGGGAFQLDIARAARNFGQLVVLDASALAPAFELADHTQLADVSDVASVVRIARSLDVTHVVAAASDGAIPAVSAVVDALHVPGTPSVVAARCRDKLECVRTLERAGHWVPRTQLVEHGTTAKLAVDALGGYPVIVKPRVGDGGQGVSLVPAEAQLDAAFSCAQRAYGPGAHAVLIQECIQGRALGVEAFFAQGELLQGFVLDDQFEADFLSPAGHALPSTLPQHTAREVLDSIAAAARSVGFRDGPVNFDLRHDGARTCVIEINPRLGGNGITDLVRAAHGVELAEASVRRALGIDARPALAQRHSLATATRMILKRGRGTALYSTAALRWRDHADVLALDLLVNDGQPAHIRVGGWTLLGRTLVRASDGPAAARLAECVARDVAEHVCLRAD